ncbi:MAG: leucyl aminopeptidase [Anaplasmataceae bacterium]|nr:leucyl aminopeptidase [Anaplasmataceae bacterium]
MISHISPISFTLNLTPEGKGAFIMVLHEGSKVERHSLYKELNNEDKNYLLHFASKLPLAHRAHAILLPSGKRVVVIGLSAKKDFHIRKSILAIRQAVQIAKREKLESIVLTAEDYAPSGELTSIELLERIAEQCELANYEFDLYKEKTKDNKPLYIKNIEIVYKDKSKRALEALKSGQVIGEAMNGARSLANTPGGDMTPVKLAEAAEKIGKQFGVKVKVLDEHRIEKLKMGGVIGVSKGSIEKPRFIVMEYMNGGKNQKPIVLVGKGVTFDSGGLSLKPSKSMYEDPMFMDMTGGAVVINVIAALARLKTKKNVVAIVPAVENMVSGSSYRPGDLLKTMSGKTIEVANTDAEGRVILSDALTYAQKFYSPKLVIDVATLTGAADVAVGPRFSAILSPDHSLAEKFRALSEKNGDNVWPLPLWEEYEEDIKAPFGDLSNVGRGRAGGVITAAAFLWQFIKETPWVHLDIASRMVTTEGDFLARGSTGAGTSLLIHFLRKS